jgi:hypothetical protein
VGLGQSIDGRSDGLVVCMTQSGRVGVEVGEEGEMDRGPLTVGQ